MCSKNIIKNYAVVWLQHLVLKPHMRVLVSVQIWWRLNYNRVNYDLNIKYWSFLMSCTIYDVICPPQIPGFNKKEELFDSLCEYSVPMKRAIWFIKVGLSDAMCCHDWIM